jgi:hypothetical protein
MSDTHGNLRLAVQALDEMAPVDFLVHAGDNYEDASRLAATRDVRVVAVTGNCDHHVDGPPEKLLEVNGHRIFVTHGHQYRVKRGLRVLASRALELKADIAIFGHTHLGRAIAVHGVLLLNPGSPHAPVGPHPYAYAILELDGTQVRPHLAVLGQPNTAAADQG